jgi:hypothetical protein
MEKRNIFEKATNSIKGYLEDKGLSDKKEHVITKYLFNNMVEFLNYVGAGTKCVVFPAYLALSRRVFKSLTKFMAGQSGFPPIPFVEVAISVQGFHIFLIEPEHFMLRAIEICSNLTVLNGTPLQRHYTLSTNHGVFLLELERLGLRSLSFRSVLMNFVCKVINTYGITGYNGKIPSSGIPLAELIWKCYNHCMSLNYTT